MGYDLRVHTWHLSGRLGKEINFFLQSLMYELGISSYHGCADTRVLFFVNERDVMQLVLCLEPWLDLSWVKIDHGDCMLSWPHISLGRPSSPRHLLPW